MQIGEFAILCNTEISVLRYYDKTELLEPEYTDRFTGYRYYSAEQVKQFKKIVLLKEAGFSLSEIKSVLKNGDDVLSVLLEKKLAELNAKLEKLDEIEKLLSGDNIMEKETDTESENIELPFENDPSIVGKWIAVGIFASTEDFENNIPYGEPYALNEVIYFLPNGEPYWCYRWTKGKLIIDDGISTSVRPYCTEIRNNQKYMFIDYKIGEYLHTGKKTIIVYRQADNKEYRADELSRKDNIDLPFVNDPNIIGKWEAVDFIKHKEAFDPCVVNIRPLFWSDVEFKENGSVTSHYDWGKDEINGDNQQVWTKGFLIRKWNHSACAYEIINCVGKDYMIIEWKSGDYRYGGLDTDYYVFMRKK